MNISYIFCMVIFPLIISVSIIGFLGKKKLKEFLQNKKNLEDIISSTKEIKQYKETLEQNASDLEKKVSELKFQSTFLEEKWADQLEKYDSQIELINKSLDEHYEKEKNLYLINYQETQKDIDEATQSVKDEYLSILASLSKEVLNKSNELIDLRKKVEIAVNQDKQKLQEKKLQDFFKLNLTDKDLSDIKLLTQIEDQLFNKEIINKLLWKTYYEKPTSFLIGRVLESNKSACGIYKITNLETNMSYIGQSVNIGERWKQHIKRGLGAEPATKNKLYPEMSKYGVHCFSFEVLQLCSKDKLNELEKYWIDFYQTKTFGYNSTSGNA